MSRSNSVEWGLIQRTKDRKGPGPVFKGFDTIPKVKIHFVGNKEPRMIKMRSIMCHRLRGNMRCPSLLAQWCLTGALPSRSLAKEKYVRSEDVAIIAGGLRFFL